MDETYFGIKNTKIDIKNSRINLKISIFYQIYIQNEAQKIKNETISKKKLFFLSRMLHLKILQFSQIQFDIPQQNNILAMTIFHSLANTIWKTHG